MKALPSVFIALVAGIAIFSSYKYFSSIREKCDLLNEMKCANEQITVITAQRERVISDLENAQTQQKVLAGENTKLQGQLKVSQENMIKMQAELQASQKTLEELNSEFSVAKAENAALNKQVGTLQVTAAAAEQEKEQLRARLNSLAELKKAIGDLKRKLSGARQEITTRIQKDQLIIGNGGYMIKDGKPIFPTRVTIEVVPLPAQNP
jgi:chromosome segregation ATPase